MKALLLKDWYMATKYFRSYLLIAAVFIGLTLFAGVSSNLFNVVYPCLLCGMIPVNLLSYDERSGWQKYSAALPYTKMQIVSEKYLFGLICQSAMLAVTGIALGINMYSNGRFEIRQYLLIMITVLLASVLSSSLSLPFVFKVGTEKGRMMYLFTIGAVCAIAVTSSVITEKIMMIDVNTALVIPLLCILSILLYALSWSLSYTFFKKREL